MSASEAYAMTLRRTPLRVGAASPAVPGVAEVLCRYGYLSSLELSASGFTEVLTDDLSTGLLNYQRFFGLDETGELDEATWRSLQAPRCDIGDFETFARLSSRVVNYLFVGPAPAGLTDLTVLKQFGLAMDQWHGVGLKNGPFRFVDVMLQAQADLTLSWGNSGGSAQWPDAIAFATVAGTGASSRITFIDSTSYGWAVGLSSGRFDVRSVCLHELGHILGLGHNCDSNSVMYPQFLGVAPTKLPSIDAQALSALYP